MAWEWRENNREKVLEALRKGEYEAILTSKEGALDALAHLAWELGILEAVNLLRVKRERDGIPDELLLRTLAVLPFVEAIGLSAAADTLFEDAAVLLQLGYTAVQIQAGFNERHGANLEQKSAQSLPYHPDVLRQELQRLELTSLDEFRKACIRQLFQRGLVKGQVYAIDGSGLGEQIRVVGLLCLGKDCPLWVTWRLRTGNASEKGKEAQVVLEMIAELVEIEGVGVIEWLLLDALYADGPLVARLKYRDGIDVLVRLPEDRCLYQQMSQTLGQHPTAWQTHLDVRYVAGHKQTRHMRVAAVHGLNDWDTFVEQAQAMGIEQPTLSVYAVRSDLSLANGKPEEWALVSTTPFGTAWQGYTFWRNRWTVENSGFRELKEGWHLETGLWTFHNPTVAAARLTFTLLAFNVAQIAKTHAGRTLTARGIRTLRRQIAPRFGSVPVIVFTAEAFTILHIEELVALLGGKPPHFSFWKAPSYPP
jgi:hypothetical protein